MSKSKSKAKTKQQIAAIKAARAIERREHFAQGGDLVAWRGGTRTVTVDRKKQNNKHACRGNWQ